MVIECPHCHTRVLPRQGNTCPACQNNISDLEELDPNVVSMVMHESQELPPFCYSCNSHTERHVRVSGDKESYLENLILGQLRLKRPRMSSSSCHNVNSVPMKVPQNL